MSGIDRTNPTTTATAATTATTPVVDLPDDSHDRFSSVLGRVRGRVQRFELVGREIEVAAVPVVQVGRRVVDQDHGDVGAAVDVGEHRGDPGHLVGEEQVLGVGPAGRCTRTRLPLRDADPVDEHASTSGRTRSSAAGSHQGSSPVSNQVRLADVPASSVRVAQDAVQLLQVSGDISSQRSMISAARGSVARASAFSWSVMVITRRVRISSISVESNSAPALCSAISG